MTLLFESGGRYRREELAATSSLLVSALSRAVLNQLGMLVAESEQVLSRPVEN
jgi:hypothetical protein